jgi:hypothetical protein
LIFLSLVKQKYPSIPHEPTMIIGSGGIIGDFSLI